MATCFPVLVERARSVLSLILVSGCEQWRKQVYGELVSCSEKLYMCVFACYQATSPNGVHKCLWLAEVAQDA